MTQKNGTKKPTPTEELKALKEKHANLEKQHKDLQEMYKFCREQRDTIQRRNLDLEIVIARKETSGG